MANAYCLLVTVLNTLHIENNLICYHNHIYQVPLLMEKEMATHSSILAWQIPWTEGAWRAAVLGVVKESDTT